MSSKDQTPCHQSSCGIDAVQGQQECDAQAGMACKGGMCHAFGCHQSWGVKRSPGGKMAPRDESEMFTRATTMSVGACSSACNPERRACADQAEQQ